MEILRKGRVWKWICIRQGMVSKALWQERGAPWADVMGLPFCPLVPTAVVVEFQDERESAILVVWSSWISEKNLRFRLLCHPQAHSAGASLGEQAEGLSTPGQRVWLRAYRHLRERKTLAWSYKAVHQILIHKMNLWICTLKTFLFRLCQSYWGHMALSSFYGWLTISTTAIRLMANLASAFSTPRYSVKLLNAFFQDLDLVGKTLLRS